MQSGTFGAVIAIISFGLNGCAGSGGGFLGIGAVVGDRNLAAAEPLFSKDEQNCLGSADRLIGALFGPAADVGPSTARGPNPCSRIRTNFRYMLSRSAPGPNSPLSYNSAQRNEIIDALLASSNQKCTRYAALLKNADGAMNAGLSVGSIITGGLGSILGGVNTAKALAGSSAILSGSRAALNDTYLSNQTIHVLVAAFDKARRTQRRQITNRQACDVEQYTLMRGIEDAYAYHDNCSIVAGLAETALSIERSENPGLDAMRTQLNEITNLRRQMAELAGEGPITPINAASTPASLDKLVTADGALTAAKAALTKAEADKVTAETALAAAKTSLAALEGADNSVETKLVTDATDAVGKSNAVVVRLATVHEAARRARNAEVHALVRSTAGAPALVDPETRSCPYA